MSRTIKIMIQISDNDEFEDTTIIESIISTNTEYEVVSKWDERVEGKVFIEDWCLI